MRNSNYATCEIVLNTIVTFTVANTDIYMFVSCFDPADKDLCVVYYAMIFYANLTLNLIGKQNKNKENK